LIDKQLREPVRYALVAPGKRIRSCLVLWCCELIKGKVNRNALIASAAIEMVHTYSLITMTCLLWTMTIIGGEIDQS